MSPSQTLSFGELRILNYFRNDSISDVREAAVVSVHASVAIYAIMPSVTRSIITLRTSMARTATCNPPQSCFIVCSRHAEVVLVTAVTVHAFRQEMPIAQSQWSQLVDKVLIPCLQPVVDALPTLIELNFRKAR